MGITIHASGRIDRLDLISPLIEEIRGIAEKNGYLGSEGQLETVRSLLTK